LERRKENTVSKNVWSYTFTLQYVSMAWCLIISRYVFMAWNFTFYRLPHQVLLYTPERCRHTGYGSQTLARSGLARRRGLQVDVRRFPGGFILRAGRGVAAAAACDEIRNLLQKDESVLVFLVFHWAPRPCVQGPRFSDKHILCP